MPTIKKPTPVDVNAPPPTPIGPLDRAPAPVDVGAPPPTPIGPPDRAPAPVLPGPGTGTNNTVAATPPIPVVELPVEEPAPEGAGASVSVSTPIYIKVLSDGTVVTENTIALNFLGTGVTVAADGSTANITITAGGSNYANSNVVSLMSAFGSNTIVTTGNITGGNLLASGAVIATLLTGGNLQVTGAVSGSTVSAVGNVTGNFFIGNGSQLTGIAASYGNANVATLLAAFGSNTIVTTGNITGGNIIAATLVQSATVSASGNVTGNYFIGNGSQLTGISTSFDLEMHVSKDGNDSTGTGTILRPYLTITHALTQVTGGRNTIVIHPGGYTENPTITSQATQLITYDATGASTLVDGTVTIANVTGRIAGLKMTNLAITGNAQAYINSSTVDGQFTKSSSGYVEVDDCELQVTGNVLISGSGSISIVGNKINNLVVNNAGASVLVKGADDCVMPQVTAGSLNIVDSIIRASSNTANAVTASAGTVVTLMNNQIVTPAADSVARVSIAGYHSIISLVYDKANSTLSNSLNSVAYFQTANVDSLVSSGNITGGNLTTAGLTSTASLSITGNTATVTTANYSIGYLNIPQISLAANTTTALTDSGKHYYSTSASNLALTIANNTSVAWPVGTAISIVNRGTANITIAGDTGVSLYLAGNATAGNRTVTTYGMATVMNVAANIWMVNGTVV